MKPLFQDGMLAEYLQKQQLAVVREIDATPAARLVEQDLMEELRKRFFISSPSLNKDQQKTSSEEIYINLGSSSSSHLARGIRITLTVPFVGNGDLLFLRPNEFGTTLLMADVSRNSISITHEGVGPSSDHVQQVFQRQVKNLEDLLSWTKADVDDFNRNLPGWIEESIQKRRAIIAKLGDYSGIRV